MKLIDFANLCAQSYEGGPNFYDVGDLRFGVVDCGSVVVVTFRGSDNGMNWLRDLEAIPAVSKSGRYAHHGFVSAMNTLWPEVSARLSSNICEKPVVFTGHSLGGAIAVLFAEYLQTQAVTFGCPRVWWAPEQLPVVNHVRVVCDDDPIPKIPAIMFRHDDTDAIIRLDDPGLPIDPADHVISHYIERLEAAA